MEWPMLTLILFLGLLVIMASSVPIAFSMGLLSIIGLFFLVGGDRALFTVPVVLWSHINLFVLAAVPLFIFMAEIVLFTGMSNDVFTALQKWLGRLPGGLAITSVVACAGFAAITGSSVANTATVSLVAVPEMVNRGYDKRLATGSVCAGGALGILIPPSIPMIFYAIVTEQSVGEMFMAGIIPGILLTLVFCVYIGIRVARNPRLASYAVENYTWKDKFFELRKMWGMVLLAILILGSIYTGITTPTEAAALGAFGALVLAVIYRKLNWPNLRKAFMRTVQVNSMILFIFLAAVLFSQLLTNVEIPQNLARYVVSLPLSRWTILVMMMVAFMILGCFLDPTPIILLTMPAFFPVIMTLGFDPIWFGILVVINMEMACITPPVGFNLFVMRGVAEPLGVTMGDIYRGIAPFVVLDAIVLAAAIIFPQIITWLPRTMG
ncbi:MAG: TRAP transporter large permease subunit [Chloroflexi bacterium]|nr:TRAP transporter large permease subunit [Chloroflexota bacterium]